jgi:hypothetical protein
LALGLIPGWLSWAEEQNPAGAYMATWIAFNAIYVAEYNRPYAERAKSGPKYPPHPNEYGLRLVRLQTSPSEHDMVRHAIEKLPTDFKRELINLPSPTKKGDTCLGFFARRAPIWEDQEIVQDALGQLVNGVINIRRTISREEPYWSPVDQQALEHFATEAAEGKVPNVPDILTKQVGDILYTVRNNLFHGCKGSDDAYDDEVLQNTLQLLQAIVNFYIDWTEHPMPD